MPFYKNWGFVLLVVWVVAFFANWAVHGGDPINLVVFELGATLIWLILYVRFGRQAMANAGEAPQMPVHLWIVTGLAVIWYAMGAASYVASQTGSDVIPGHPHPPPYPAWVDAAWAFGVWGGLVASLLLPMRSRYAVPAFGVSVAGLLVHSVHARPFWLTTGAPSFLVFQGVVVALLLLFYAWRMRRRGVLR